MAQPPHIFFSQKAIQQAVQRIAREILRWSELQEPSPLLLGVLEGARPLVGDLAHTLGEAGWEPEIAWIGANATDGSRLLEVRALELSGELAQRVSGRAVLIVDDLVDSGKTLGALQRAIEGAGAQRTRTAALIHKYAHVGPQPDFLGFDLALDAASLKRAGFADVWLYGYGMDLDGELREAPEVRSRAIRLGE